MLTILHFYAGLIEKIFNDTGLITLVAAFLKQHTVNVVEEELG